MMILKSSSLTAARS